MATKFEKFVSDNKVSEKPTKKERQVAEKQNKSVAEVREEASGQSSKVTVTSSSSSGSRSSSSGSRSSSSGSRSSSSGSRSSRSKPKKPEQKKSQFEEYVGGSTPEETKKASRQQQKSQQKQKPRMGPPKPTQYQRYQERQTVNTGNINQGQRTSSTRFQDTQKQFRTDTLQPEIAPQSRINQRQAAPRFRDRDRQRLQDISDRGVRVSDFDEITDLTGKGRASYNIETGGGQGTVSKRQQENIDVIKGVEAKKTSKAAGTTLKTAGIGAAAGVAAPLLPGAITMLGTGYGAATLGKELGTIGRIKDKRPEEARFRAQNLVTGVLGGVAGFKSSRSVLKGAKKTTSRVGQKAYDLDQVNIFSGKKARVGGKIANKRSGKISKGQLRKGKAYRQDKAQKDIFKDMLKTREKDLSRVKIKQEGGFLGGKPAKRTTVSIKPKGSRQRLTSTTTKDLITQKKSTLNIPKPKQGVKLGQAGQSVRPQRLNNLDISKSGFKVSHKLKPFPKQSKAPKQPQAQPQTTITKAKTENFVKTKNLDSTPSDLKNINLRGKNFYRTVTPDEKGFAPKGVRPQESTTKTSITPKGFRPGRKESILGRLRRKKNLKDISNLPKRTGSLSGVRPNVKNKLPGRAMRLSPKKKTTVLTTPATDQKRDTSQDLSDISTQETQTDTTRKFYPQKRPGQRKPRQDTDIISKLKEQNPEPVQDTRPKIGGGSGDGGIGGKKPKEPKPFIPPPPPKIGEPTPPPTPPTKPEPLGFPGLPYVPLGKTSKKPTKRPSFFSVDVRRQGKQKTIARGLTRGQAKIRLRSELKGTLARSGRVRGLGTINLGFGFRKPKKGSILPFGSVVQKREFSLGSKGEKYEIKRSRKSKNFLGGIL